MHCEKNESGGEPRSGYRESQLIITRFGKNKLKIIVLLQRKLNISLLEVKKLTDKLPVIIDQNQYSQLERLAEELLFLECEVTVHCEQTLNQETCTSSGKVFATTIPHAVYRTEPGQHFVVLTLGLIELVALGGLILVHPWRIPWQVWLMFICVGFFLTTVILYHVTEMIQISPEGLTYRALFKVKKVSFASLVNVSYYYNFKRGAKNIREVMVLRFRYRDRVEEIECDFMGSRNFIKLINLFDAEIAEGSLRMDEGEQSSRWLHSWRGRTAAIFVFIILVLVMLNIIGG